MCFPFLFRAALDVRASSINEPMKMAAAVALAALAKEPVCDTVREAIPGREFEFGKDYVIPTPFDPRIIDRIPSAVAKAAIESGVAKVHITDWGKYTEDLHAIRDYNPANQFNAL